MLIQAFLANYMFTFTKREKKLILTLDKTLVFYYRRNAYHFFSI